MPDTFSIDTDGKYAVAVADTGRVSLLRYGQQWIDDPDGAEAWLAAAVRIAELSERVIIDIDAPAGFEVSDVSDAKDEVIDLLNTTEGEDNITVADAIVTALLERGWRPTDEDSDD